MVKLASAFLGTLSLTSMAIAAPAIEKRQIQGCPQQAQLCPNGSYVYSSVTYGSNGGCNYTFPPCPLVPCTCKLPAAWYCPDGRKVDWTCIQASYPKAQECSTSSPICGEPKPACPGVQRPRRTPTETQSSATPTTTTTTKVVQFKVPTVITHVLVLPEGEKVTVDVNGQRNIVGKTKPQTFPLEISFLSRHSSQTEQPEWTKWADSPIDIDMQKGVQKMAFSKILTQGLKISGAYEALTFCVFGWPGEGSVKTTFHSSQSPSATSTTDQVPAPGASTPSKGKTKQPQQSADQEEQSAPHQPEPTPPPPYRTERARMYHDACEAFARGFANEVWDGEVDRAVARRLEEILGQLEEGVGDYLGLEGLEGGPIGLMVEAVGVGVSRLGLQFPDVFKRALACLRKLRQVEEEQVGAMLIKTHIFSTLLAHLSSAARTPLHTSLILSTLFECINNPTIASYFTDSTTSPSEIHLRRLLQQYKPDSPFEQPQKILTLFLQKLDSFKSCKIVERAATLLRDLSQPTTDSACLNVAKQVLNSAGRTDLEG
ncbi:hypothetical protein HK097_008556, partial [Rhizophlyctis rosea]